MTTLGVSIGGEVQGVINPSVGSSPARPILDFEGKIAAELRMAVLRSKLSSADRMWTNSKREYDIVSKWGDGSGKNVKKVMDAADCRRNVIRNRIKQLAKERKGR